jgi:hypothetical protein
MSTATGETANMAYKSDQGRLARLAAFWSLAALVFYGCVSLRQTLSAAFGGALSKPFLAGMKQIPVLGLTFNAALLIAEAVNSSLVVIVCVLFLMGFLAGADYLLGRWTTLILTGGKG